MNEKRQNSSRLSDENEISTEYQRDTHKHTNLTNVIDNGHFS